MHDDWQPVFHTSMQRCMYLYLSYKTFTALKDLFFHSSKVSFNLYSMIINDKIIICFLSKIKKTWKLFSRKSSTWVKKDKKVLFKKHTHHNVYIFFCVFQQTPVTLFPWIVRQWKKTRGVTRQQNLPPPPRRSPVPPRKTPRPTMTLFRNQNSLVLMITLWLLLLLYPSSSLPLSLLWLYSFTRKSAEGKKMMMNNGYR